MYDARNFVLMCLFHELRLAEVDISSVAHGDNLEAPLGNNDQEVSATAKLLSP
jgi:hypothetical protein